MIEDWLQKRIGSGRMNVATGKLDRNTKYQFKPEGYIPDIPAYIQGNIDHLYGSCLVFPDGKTYLLGFDCDTPELDGQVLSWQKQLAAAGTPSIRWKRRQGRCHLEVYTASPVDCKAFYAHLISVCPGLEAVPEVFPLDLTDEWSDRNFSSLPLTWPLWYRVDDQVYECAAEVMFPGYQLPMKSTGIQSDRNRLTWLLSQAVTVTSM